MRHWLDVVLNFKRTKKDSDPLDERRERDKEVLRRSGEWEEERRVRGEKVGRGDGDEVQGRATEEGQQSCFSFAG